MSGDTDVFYLKVDDLVWSEIDDEHHLNRAKIKIFPAIQEKDNSHDS